MDDDRGDRCQHFDGMAVFMPDKIDVPLLAVVLIAITDYIMQMMGADNQTHTHSGHFRDGVACQLAGLFISVDDIALQIQGNNRIMIIFFQGGIPLNGFLQHRLYGFALCYITAYRKHAHAIPILN
ncbi:hypothetical protein D3C80_1645990 [compost metagenome]